MMKRSVRTSPMVVLGLLSVVAAGCGSGSSTPSAPSSQPSSSAPSTGSSAPAGTSGTVAAVAAAHLEVQNPANGQVTVDFGSSTRFSRTGPASRSDVTVGSCVVVSAAPGAPASTSGGVTATSVAISAATANGCARGPGGFGGGNGGGRRGTGGASATPRPNGGRGFSGTFGKVTSVAGPLFVVQGVSRAGTASAASPAPVPVSVTTTASTTYSKTSTATASALAVGQCVTAVGPSDDTGAVTARSISIRPAGPGGCTSGRRFGGRPGQGAGAGSGGNGA